MESSPQPQEQIQQPAEHWADHYMRLDVSELQLRDGVGTVPGVNEVQDHLGLLWEQEQSLVELVDARLNGRESPIGEDELKRLGLPTSVLSSSASLANELFTRLGPNNEMTRSDVLLTMLAASVVEELYQKHTGNTDKLNPEMAEPMRSMQLISAFSESLSRNPELVEGSTKDLMLVAEMLAEGMRAPDRARNKAPSLSELSAADIDRDYYRTSVVQICDAVIEQTSAVPSAPGDNASKNALKRYKKDEKNRTSSLQGALLTKYDMLFDTLEASTNQVNYTENASVILSKFSDEVSQVIDQLEWGYAYELFAPLLFRYVALQSGQLKDVRIWHSSKRSDTPNDGLGFKQGERDAPLISEGLRKQSSDAVLGSTAGTNSDEPNYGAATRYLQLKGRTDADSFKGVYDDHIIDIHSQDAVAILGTVQEALSIQTLDLNNPVGLEQFEDQVVPVAEEVMKAIVEEVHRRLVGKVAESNHGFTVKVGERDLVFDIPKLLDESVVPVYKKMQRELTPANM